ncbi:hypothetical protein BDZ45DRAFT_705265 [Acephala macrosclerotiorum]|nr:hypothetical protein BDZ45DRAFT_705265 [Acephala macrosclerotiorum]
MSNYSERRRPGNILILLCITIVTIDFSAYLSVAPQILIFETIICRRLHNEDILAGGDDPCKSLDVRGELALLNGWKDMLDQLPGIALALLYGASWQTASDVSRLFGGSSLIAISIEFTMIAELFEMEKRATAFFVVSAANLRGEILAAPISAFLMSWTPWLPFTLGVVSEGMGLLVAIVVPETKNCYGGTVLAFLIASVGNQTQLIIQYASRRFSWSVGKASLLKALKGIVALVNLLLFLLWLSINLSRHMSPMAKDFQISQSSAWVLALCTTLMAIAPRLAVSIPGVCIFALGMMVAGPILVSAIRRGIQLDGLWLGLPYMACASLVIGSSLLTSGIRLSEGEE